MDDFELIGEHLLRVMDGQELAPEFRDACLRARENLLRGECAGWHRSYLPQFAAVAAELRRAAQTNTGGAPCYLELAAHFDGLVSEPMRVPYAEDEGPY